MIHALPPDNCGEVNTPG